jgi:hypothetical protein
LRAFAKAGGKVVFIGDPPSLVVDKNFLHATGPAEIAWATLHEKTITITPAVLGHLPEPDFALDRTNALVSYVHRQLRDADVYFIFNSGEEKASFTATLEGTGDVERWNADTGSITPLTVTAPRAGVVSVPLQLEPWSSATLVVRGQRAARN